MANKSQYDVLQLIGNTCCGEIFALATGYEPSWQETTHPKMSLKASRVTILLRASSSSGPFQFNTPAIKQKYLGA
ncbi:hypothetical protein [Yersinia enterocolitica]|uniref:hypothetical protein n=1 Tax=Yersinia enterocolitica TaxID=630 RepID=UPI003D0795FC|nr:hypothetical protein [Yersinia enterocolitica]